MEVARPMEGARNEMGQRVKASDIDKKSSSNVIANIEDERETNRASNVRFQ